MRGNREPMRLRLTWRKKHLRHPHSNHKVPFPREGDWEPACSQREVWCQKVRNVGCPPGLVALPDPLGMNVTSRATNSYRSRMLLQASLRYCRRGSSPGKPAAYRDLVRFHASRSERNSCRAAMMRSYLKADSPAPGDRGRRGIVIGRSGLLTRRLRLRG